MSKHVIVGAGPIGTATAELLAAQGHQVTLVTRSGTGPQAESVTLVAADASDASRLIELTRDAAAVYNCANPPYTSWPQDWPPLAKSLTDTAAATGAVLVTCSNLYGYGPVDGPITVDLPLSAPGTKSQIRAQMWHDALALHQAGTIRATEARGSDYVGAGAQSHLGDRVVPRLLAGKGVRVVGSPDQPHSWTYTRDMARTLVQIGATEQAWGRAWHVPTNPPLTQRAAIEAMAQPLRVSMVSVKGLSRTALSAAGLFSPMIREIKETFYQFNEPFVIDDSVTRAELGIEPTPWVEVLANHVSPFQANESAIV
ncbi:MAG: NAD-dependent epimerase/dehydratase family protein [Candidatus Nanopelagicales bacterium]